MILYIERQYTWKHVLIVKDFIVDINHGLNGNKFMNTTNVYSPQPKKKHIIRRIEILHNGEKSFKP
jgi:hypothetical protein